MRIIRRYITVRHIGGKWIFQPVIILEDNVIDEGETTTSYDDALDEELVLVQKYTDKKQ